MHLSISRFRLLLITCIHVHYPLLTALFAVMQQISDMSDTSERLSGSSLDFLRQHLHSGEPSSILSNCGAGRQPDPSYDESFDAWNASYGNLSFKDINGSSVLQPPYSSLSCSGTCPCNPSGFEAYNDILEDTQNIEGGELLSGIISVKPGDIFASSRCEWLIAATASITIHFPIIEIQNTENYGQPQEPYDNYDFLVINSCKTADCFATKEIARLSSSGLAICNAECTSVEGVTQCTSLGQDPGSTDAVVSSPANESTPANFSSHTAYAACNMSCLR